MALTCNVHFHDRLIDLIKSRQNATVTKTLKRHRSLVNAVDNRGSLLHHAVLAGNVKITQYLISSGSPIDCRRQDGKTPLMLAIGPDRIMEFDRKSIVRLLLGAGASVDLVDASGESILHTTLHSTELDFKIVEAVLLRAKAVTPSIQELVEKFIKAKGTFAHAALLKDVEVMKELLQRGFDVDSRDNEERTALHYAALTKELEVAKLLIERGADVNACYFQKVGPLLYAANRKDPDMIQLLLEHGADPDPDVDSFDFTPLYESLIFEDAKDAERCDECAELLLRYGAFPYNPHLLVHQLLEFDETIIRSPRLNCLIAHQAMIDMIREERKEKKEQVPDEEEENHLTDFDELKDYYNMCRQVLEVKVFGTKSLFDLLGNCGKHKMRTLARNAEFVRQIEQYYMEPGFKEPFQYYASTLEKRIIKAVRTVELEKKGISVISDIFNCDYNQSYIFARHVIDFMSESELEKLCDV